MPRKTTEVVAPDPEGDCTAIPTSREVARRFGHYCDEAMLRRVIFKRHGEPQIVILSLGEYQRLKAFDQPNERRAYRVSELPDDDFEALKCSRDALAVEVGRSVRSQ